MEQVIDCRVITTIIINSTNRTNITKRTVIFLLIMILFAASITTFILIAIIVVAGHLLGLVYNVVNIIIILQCILIIGLLFFSFVLGIHIYIFATCVCAFFTSSAISNSVPVFIITICCLS